MSSSTRNGTAQDSIDEPHFQGILFRMEHIDRTRIFSDLCARNKLRREAQLPLLNMKTEYSHEIAKANFAHRRALLEERRAEIKAEILEKMRARYGPYWPNDLGGRYWLGAMVERTLRQRFGF